MVTFIILFRFCTTTSLLDEASSPSSGTSTSPSLIVVVVLVVVEDVLPVAGDGEYNVFNIQFTKCLSLPAYLISPMDICSISPPPSAGDEKFKITSVAERNPIDPTVTRTPFVATNFNPNCSSEGNIHRRTAKSVGKKESTPVNKIRTSVSNEFVPSSPLISLVSRRRVNLVKRRKGRMSCM